MSGVHAMAVSLDERLAARFGTALYDACLSFAEMLVCNAGGVIEGVKPAAIFSLPMHAYSGGTWRRLSRAAVDEALRAYAQTLPAYGVCVKVLYRTERRVFLLVWREGLLAELLGDGELLDILREQGYEGGCAQELVRELRRRLVAYYRATSEGIKGSFPHEIGVFLGYPSRDVRGFMAGEKATCVGAWHAYGDEREARRRFAVLERHERRCRLRFAAGEPLSALFAA